jgi:PAS domain S-box-containing protein
MADMATMALPPQSEKVLAAALDAAAVAVVVVDRSGRPAYVNSAACDLTGYTAGELTAESVLARVAPEDRSGAAKVLERMWQGDLPSDYTITWLDRRGRRIQLRWRFSHLADEVGAVTHLVCVGIDVTRQHVLGEARRAAEERFRRSFDAAPVGMAIVRADDDPRFGTIVGVNRALCRMLAARENDVVGRTVADFTHPDDTPHERRWIAEWLAHGAEDVYQYEKRMLGASGEVVHASIRVSLIEGDPGGRFFLAHVVDITDRKVAEDAAVGNQVDPVTGLLTEPAFLRALRATMAEDQPLSVTCMRLLPAADVQAVHGYAARDELVERGATRLAHALPPDARVGRTGPDEFAAFFKATGREALEIARDTVSRIGRAPSPGTLSSAPMAFAAGVAANDPGRHEPPEAVYTSAQIALEDAVRSGTVAALSGRRARERAAKRLSWQSRLRRGLDQAGFLVHGQPVARLDTGEVEFTELSLRMEDEDGKLVFPAVFLPVAESTGLITAIDRWLLERVIDLLRERPDEHLAIRLSAATLTDPTAGESAIAVLRRERDVAERLIVEMVGTDGSFSQRSTAHRLTDCGCRLLLLGASVPSGAMHYARSLPLWAQRIHGSFTRDVEDSDRARAVVRALADALRALDIRSIAEFVETPSASAALRDAGIDWGQGFHFGRPGPV